MTIILTTHYIEEAEEMADRVGVINKGEIILVEDKAELMRKLGKKQLTLAAAQRARSRFRMRSRLSTSTLADDGNELVYTYDTQGERTGITRLLDALARRRHPLQGPAHDAELAGRNLRQPGERTMNCRAVWAIYGFEMARTGRTLMQSIAFPVISTSLYFVVFGAAIGSRITEMEGVSYGAFIVPGLVMMMLLTQSTSNASFGIYFPRFAGTIYEILSAPVSYIEIVLGYVGAAATKSIILGAIILATAALLRAVAHRASGLDGGVPGADSGELQPARLHHRHLGRRLRKAAADPALGADSADVPGRHVLFHQRAAAGLADHQPVQPDRLSGRGFRWSFFEMADVDIRISVAMTLVFLALCLAVVAWIFRTGYKLKN